MQIDDLKPGYARVSAPEISAGSKEYVPVDADHEHAIAEGKADVWSGVPAGPFGNLRKVRLNCTYDVMDANGKVTQMRAGFEKVYDPKNEQMDDRACAGIKFKNPTWEQEVYALPSGGKPAPTFTGWGIVPANTLKPAFPTTYGVRVGGR